MLLANGTVDEVTSASSGQYTLLAYESNGASRLSCFIADPNGFCPGTICSMPNLQHVTSAPELSIANWTGGKILGAWKPVGGNIGVGELQVGSNCISSGANWVQLGTVSNSASSTKLRAVRAGNRPGVVYEQGGQLKLWYVTP